MIQKTIVITGVTSGIGLAVAEGLVKEGATLIGVGRSPERCQQTEERLRTLHPQGGLVAVMVADLSIQAEIRALAQKICEQLKTWNQPALDVLINNAGTVPFWQTFTAEGFDTQWAVNHLAPFLLTHELLPLLKAAPAARVITVSSGSHYNTRLDWEDIQLRRHYSALRAYKQTKLANVLFTTELNRQLTGSTVRAFAADPGLVNTEIGLKSNSFVARWAWDLRRRGGIPAVESAKGIIYLATEPGVQNSAEVYWKHGKPKSPSPYALDAQAAQRLWNISAQMCGIQEK
ncbi:MAG TPA: SDR family NAD(P)-dependent oxidoreductase [Anaerolineales bacterium]|nr:SDR family NAD(P)-dependent oxidoreductase [Anaerolineales bacterium]